MAFSVQGKTALVTGAGSGICFSFASQLLRKGCNVVIADLSLRPEAQELLDSSAGNSPRAVFQKTDVTVWTDLERAIATGVSQFGSIDIFCPGAGVFEPKWSNFWYPPGTSASVDKPDSDGYKTLDICLTHPLRLTQLAIAHFISRKAPGNIVHISSIAAQYPNVMNPIYAVAKAGVSQLIRSFAPLQARVNIRVTGVAPGLVKTPLFLENEDKLSLIDQQKDVWVTADEVAEAMINLIEDPKYEAGTVLEIAAKSTREVKMFNDPGPGDAEGIRASNIPQHFEEVFTTLAKEGWGVIPGEQGKLA